MPNFDEIAQVRVEVGTRPAEVPLSSLGGPNAAIFFRQPLAGVSQYMLRLSHLWNQWGLGSRSFLQVPFVFGDDGQPVDASSGVAALYRNVSRLRFTIGGALDDGNDFIAITGAGPSQITDEHALLIRSGLYTDNHGADAGTALLDGLKMTVETLVGGQYRNVFPAVKTFSPRSIWVRRGDIVGDFAALALTADAGLQAVARKSVTLEAAYDPLLEDLDTQIIYGADDNGLPIVWTLEGTVRTADGMQLNLAADLV